MNLKSIVIISLFFSVFFSCKSEKKETISKPKLVVGIVIDQMRPEYLYRFQENYTKNGFKRLIREGFNVKNVHHNYIPTATGPGHVSIYTGTTPTNHGIVTNNWYSKKLKRFMYCAEDTTAFLVDNSGLTKGLEFANYQRSPKNEETTTITDELKLFTNNRAKVIGISLKDRAAIFPVGHLADAAYWYNNNNGNFVTSSYYRNELPEWLQEFNNQKKADSLLNLTWDTFLPLEKYKNSNLDETNFEKIFIGRNNSTFPYDLKVLRNENNNYGLLSAVPQGNTIVTALAKATIVGEQLGKGAETDFLTISYSSTDYVGHHYGIRSKELEDTYVRMDREIEMLLNTLDKEVGKENYTLFLTADHGGSDNPPFLQSRRLPGKFYNSKRIREELNTHLSKKFGKNNYISHMALSQIYLTETNIPKQKVLEETIVFLATIEGLKEAVAPTLKTQRLNNSQFNKFIKNSYHSKRSGDVFYFMKSGWMENQSHGTTHGSSYNTDTHVPLLWYGANIQQGFTVKKKNITQIAPTLSMLLNIPLASSSDKNPIEELFEK